jgi:hypothetical protein
MLDLVFNDLVNIGSEKMPAMTSDAQEALKASLGALQGAKIAIATTGNIIAYRDILQAREKVLVDHGATLRGILTEQDRRVKYWMIPFS